MVTFTTSPIYYRPLVPRITITHAIGGTPYYTYDPWTDSGTTSKAVSCNVSLSQNHQGIFTVQIEDETKALDTNIGLNSKVTIECGKQSTQMTPLISGLVRQDGYSRGADRKVIRTLSGSSTAIRFNERLSYFVQEARKLAQDNTTIDITDPNMKADVLLQALLTNTGQASQLITLANDVFTASGIVASSDVETFVASLNVELASLQDGISIIEDSTGGEVSLDTSGIVQFRHNMQPATPGKGFTIKNKPPLGVNIDNADDTMYLKGRNWDFSLSALTSDSYSNDTFGMLPSENAPSRMEDLGYREPPNWFGNTSTAVEYAQKFRPTHNRFLPGDVFIVGSQWTTAATGGSNWNQWFRICTDTGGVPTDVGGIVLNILFRYRVWPDTVQNGTGLIANLYRLTNDQLFVNSASVLLPNGVTLDTTRDYWLIASNKGMIASLNFSWALDQTPPAITPVGGFLKHSSTFSTDSAGGANWNNIAVTGKPCFAMPRMRSQAFHCYDPKAWNAFGQGGSNRTSQIIQSNLSNIPTSIKTTEALYRYLVNQSYLMARPRANYNIATVTAPNVPILPGDPIMISDSVLGFSTSGQQAVMATCGDMTYSWNIGEYQAPTLLSIQPVGQITRYR